MLVSVFCPALLSAPSLLFLQHALFPTTHPADPDGGPTAGTLEATGGSRSGMSEAPFPSLSTFVDGKEALSNPVAAASEFHPEAAVGGHNGLGEFAPTEPACRQ